MTPIVLVALASLVVTVLVGFAKTLRTLGQIEQRLDLLWKWYLAELGPGIPGGRRRTDPPLPWPAEHDADERPPAA